MFSQSMYDEHSNVKVDQQIEGTVDVKLMLFISVEMLYKRKVNRKDGRDMKRWKFT
jgi:hypothetical protein